MKITPLCHDDQQSINVGSSAKTLDIVNKTSSTCTTRKRHIDHIDENDDDEGSNCKKHASECF